MTTSNNIIMCFDGTDNNFGTKSPSNILELYKMLEKNSPNQHCFYQPGIGIDIDLSSTSFQNWSTLPFQNSIKNNLDSAIAFSIDYHVIQAYNYLIEKYKPNDKIYLFGFSRGSFIARILAGMIEKIGLLDNGLQSMVKTAWEIYKSWEKIGQPIDLSNPKNCSYSLELFKQTFCRYNVSIEFMGLFDSINSCGIIFDRLFPFTSNTSNVKHIRHAVSIHERRSKFKQNLFIPHSYLPHFLNPKSSCNSSNSLIDNNNNNNNNNNTSNSNLPLIDHDFVTRSNIISAQFFRKCSNDLLEVWFPGDHSDIGGNWPYDNNGNKLSNLSFRWILSYALEFGVKFKKNSLIEFNSKFQPLESALSFSHNVLSFINYNYPNFKSPYCYPENELNNYSIDNLDSSSPLFPNFTNYSSINLNNNQFNNQFNNLLINNKIDNFKGHGNENVLNTIFWWFLEILPIGYMVENEIGRWRPLYWPNFGEKRNIPLNAKIHWSILWRFKFNNDFNNESYSHLPPIFQIIKNLIENNDSIPIIPNDNLIILKLNDLIDFKTGIFRLDLTSFINNLIKSNKTIKLDIDWNNPPNELASRMNLSN